MKGGGVNSYSQPDRLIDRFFYTIPLGTIKYPSLFLLNYLDLPMALVSLWVPPAPGIVPVLKISLRFAVLEN